MIAKVVILLSIAVCVLGGGHATSEQKVVVRHKKIINADKKSDEYAWSYPSYEFSYKVHDPHTHDKKGQSENREDDEVKGEYWLIQPDGHKRIVSYHGDKKSGFNADVKYSEPHKHIDEEKKSHHIPHYPEVEHKNIIVDYKKEEKEEGEKQEEEEEQDNKEEDKDGHSSVNLGEYEPLPYRAPVVHKIRENYHHPHYYRKNRRS
ncbi:cuticular protein RR-2 motif 81 precursor [Bombyx mori]|uniref:Putative cuticle protein n=1 Tax=Bombyx mori TaxID=7091 RepID=C0H6S3_BOMMO|nr:cuticular protein RR-2 motif 81 precursor [Bombyx mori]FAA00584.1 TPA: putative cuticle protein [Bombyx mori]